MGPAETGWLFLVPFSIYLHQWIRLGIEFPMWAFFKVSRSETDSEHTACPLDRFTHWSGGELLPILTQMCLHSDPWYIYMWRRPTLYMYSFRSILAIMFRLLSPSVSSVYYYRFSVAISRLPVKCISVKVSKVLFSSLLFNACEATSPSCEFRVPMSPSRLSALENQSVWSQSGHVRIMNTNSCSGYQAFSCLKKKTVVSQLGVR